MIEYIKGTLTYLDIDYVVLETNGVGYRIFCGNPFAFQHQEGQDLTLYIYQYVREDQISLYGFATREERTLFSRLLNVSGVGPKGALAIVATGHVWRVLEAIKDENVNALTKFPGVGKKTAQRIILDLKDKLDDLLSHFADKLHERPSFHEAEEPVFSAEDVLPSRSGHREALEALKALGYSEKEVQRIAPKLKKMSEESWTTDQHIKLGLQLLMR